MITEKEFLELLTDKLIEVAHNPKLRKEFRVSYDEGSDITSIVFYKNEPLMSEIEDYALAAFRDDDNMERFIGKRPKKGSFDDIYRQAEKGDKAMMLQVAQAYRDGIGVHKNLRLAETWELIAANYKEKQNSKTPVDEQQLALDF